MLVVLKGMIRVTGRDAHGEDFPVVEHVAGSFSGELGQLSGRRSLADGTAVGDVEALLLDPEHLRALLVAEAALGEKIMRALILRRVALIETGTGGPVLVGPESHGDVARLSNFLRRNGIPYQLLDPASDHDAQAFVERYAPRAEDLPLAVCPDGSVLRNPSESALAKCIGMLDAGAIEDKVYDVAVAGAGPAGLATAVYAASEGLSVLVIDARYFGGQAGASARIENYLGFPTGISGQALAGRAFNQAQKFGATMLIPAEILRLDCAPSDKGNPFELQLAGGRKARSRTVAIATGRALPPAGVLQPARDGRARRVVLGFAFRSEAVRGRGSRAGGRRELGGAGGGVPCRARVQGLDAGARRGPRSQHVEVPHRPHRRHSEHRIAHAH